MDTLATHLLADFYGCAPQLLDDPQRVAEAMRRAARAAGATVVAEVFHPYAPQGVTGVLVIEESHFSVHTWPELGYAALDFYTCGDCRPERACEALAQALGADRREVMELRRGQRAGRRSMAVVSHAGDASRSGRTART